MDRSQNTGFPPLFGVKLTARQKQLLRQLYRKSMAAVGGAALLLSLGLQAVQFGPDGVRRLAEGAVFGGAAGDGGEADATATPPSADSDLSLFLSPPSGDRPMGLGRDGPISTDAGNVDGDGAEDPPPEPDDLPQGDAPAPPTGAAIVARDLSPAAPFSLFNMTSTLDPDLDAAYRAYLTGADARAAANTAPAGPLVLILHTHSTEGFAPEGADRLPVGSVPRSTDPEKNVVAVGAALAKTLEDRGIPTIHCTFGHDLEDYSGAYDREKQTILSYLEAYPTIRYIFDVHRDSIDGAGGSIIKTSATVGGEAAAQLMFVVGTNEKGANHPQWKDNLGYALALQAALAEEYPGLMRAVNLRGASFNEQYTPFSLLVEVGAAGNTLEEAKRTAVVLGNVVAEEILGVVGE